MTAMWSASLTSLSYDPAISSNVLRMSALVALSANVAHFDRSTGVVISLFLRRHLSFAPRQRW